MIVIVQEEQAQEEEVVEEPEASRDLEVRTRANADRHRLNETLTNCAFVFFCFYMQVKTTPFDPRFPQTNQAKHCYTRYNEFHKCQAENGEGAEECEPLAKFYRSICPTEWTEKWNEEREAGTWPGRY